MKTRTKALLLSLSAVLLVAVSVLGTVAYLTSKQTVTNTFTVGDVKITLDEENVDEDRYNSDGELTTETSVKPADRDQANDYHLLPSATYPKDPTVHVQANSEDCYVFVKVTNDIQAIEATGATTIAEQMKVNGWTQLKDANNNNVENVYVYEGEFATTDENENKVIAKAAEVKNLVVFQSIKIADDVDNTTLGKCQNKTIEVIAYAVQAEGFTNALDAWQKTYGK